MTDWQDQSATQPSSLSKHQWRCVATDVGTIGAICVGASLAVPIMSAERFNDVIWALSNLAFIGIPSLVGIVRRKPSLPANLITGMLLLACPIVYLITDPLPVRFELFRDAFFLSTGSTLTFVSAGWTGDFVRARRWAWMVATVTMNIVAAGSIAVMISIFIYLE